MRHIPPFRALQVFDAVAHHKSFSAAARDLCISQSAVSHQVKLLEHHMEETLLNRAGRKVSLTTSGQKLFTKLDGILDELGTLKSIFGDRDIKELRVATYPGFATGLVMPKLHEFGQLHPRIHVRFIMLPELTQKLTPDIADLYITCRSEQRGYAFNLLLEEELVPICSPSLFERPEMVTLSDLKQAPLIDTDFQATSTDWAHWAECNDVDLDSKNIFVTLDQASMAIQAALSGLGVTLAWPPMVESDLNLGRLVRLAMPSYRSGLKYYVAHVSNCEDKAILDFRNWLLKVLNQPSPSMPQH